MLLKVKQSVFNEFVNNLSYHDENLFDIYVVNISPKSVHKYATLSYLRYNFCTPTNRSSSNNFMIVGHLKTIFTGRTIFFSFIFFLIYKFDGF